MSDKDNAVLMAGVGEWERKAVVKTVSYEETQGGRKEPQILLETEDGVVMVWTHGRQHSMEFGKTWDHIKNGEIAQGTEITILRNASDQNVAFYLQSRKQDSLV